MEEHQTAGSNLKMSAEIIIVIRENEMHTIIAALQYALAKSCEQIRQAKEFDDALSIACSDIDFSRFN